MRGLIQANHTDGKYDVDLTSKSEYVSAGDRLALIDEQLAIMNAKADEFEALAEQMQTENEILQDAIANILDRWSTQDYIENLTASLNELPEGEERDELEAEKEALEQQIDDENPQTQVDQIAEEISQLQDLQADMEEYSPAWEAIEGDIDTLMDTGVDIFYPIKRLNTINGILDAMPAGPERDWAESELEDLEALLPELESDWEDMQSDLESLDLGLDLESSSDSLILSAAQDTIRDLRDEIDENDKNHSILILEIQSLEIKKDSLAAKQQNEIQVLLRNIWCVDLTEDLSSFIGVIGFDTIGTTQEEETDTDSQSTALQQEIDSLNAKIANLSGATQSILLLIKAAFELRKAQIEKDRKYKQQNPSTVINRLATNGGWNIQPGYEGNAVYNSTRDDVPQPDAYRYGVITAIDYELNTCTVNLGSLVNDLGE